MAYGDIIKLSNNLWEGKEDIINHHPFHLPYGLEELGESLWMHKGFANTIYKNTEDGLVIIDPAASFDINQKFKALMSLLKFKSDQIKCIRAIIFTHGHTDHVFGLNRILKYARKKKWDKPIIHAHENVSKRFDRYEYTQGYNAHINQRQFLSGSGEPYFPSDWKRPDVTYSDSLILNFGKDEIQLYHDLGETDDATWVFMPDEDGGVLCTGDFFIWGVPNGGNPQKVQRYALEWGNALKKMSDKSPKILIPGHGWLILGKDRVKKALDDTSEFILSIHNKTLGLMNQGHSLENIIKEIVSPLPLNDKPYLQSNYHEVEFIIRNIWRLYGGWYDLNPVNLKPAHSDEIAIEIINLAGSKDKVIEQAENLIKAGKFRLASHLADWVYRACSSKVEDDVEFKKRSALVMLERAKSEHSTMAMGIYFARVREIANSCNLELDLPVSTFGLKSKK